MEPMYRPKQNRPYLAGMLVLVSLPGAARAQFTGSNTQTLQAVVQPLAKLSVPAMVTMVSPGSMFAPFQASMQVSFRARTRFFFGSGSITLRLTSDFQPSGGPSAALNQLSYTCSGATIGNACSGTQTVSPTIQTPVLTLPASTCTGGGGACSAQDPNLVNLNFTMTNDPALATGAYSAQITFVISAT